MGVLETGCNIFDRKHKTLLGKDKTQFMLLEAGSSLFSRYGWNSIWNFVDPVLYIANGLTI